ncbi:hypothetical protein Emed_002412 [Eimeria media]
MSGPFGMCLLQQQQQQQLLILLLARPPHAKAPTHAPLLLQRDASSSRHAWLPALSAPSPRASAVCSAAATAAAAAAGEAGGAGSSSSSNSSSSSKCVSLPLWSRVFSRRFLFSDDLPSALSPLHAALFAEATRASRVVGVWGLSDLLKPTHAEKRGAAAVAAAAAAACLAAFASWRLLGLAARVFRKLTAQHRLAENRIYGPLHSLDATIKPLEAEPRPKRQSHKQQSAKPPAASSSSSSSSDSRSSSSSSSSSKKHALQDEEISSSKTQIAPRATARRPRVSDTDNNNNNNNNNSSSSKETDGSSSSSSSSSRKRKRGVQAPPVENVAGIKEGGSGKTRRRKAQTQQGTLAAVAEDAVSDGLDESAGQLPPEAA